MHVTRIHRRTSLHVLWSPCYFVYNLLASQDDWAGWIEFTGSVEDKVQTVGDDLTVTNIKRIKKAADEGACNALLLKVRRYTKYGAPADHACREC